ncbi:hypothetical protein BLNAU_18019 [Blattamonas nauphoetae]|uniref:Uncharacterized protein n=1 Tax=Blattamonas nauphoetae TaxID=2049346 RepID=A0ABQ9X5M6_9EUKA|nr:hypothetical protein BLNAU_18019 [Blattamonas nauphoetae]
MELQSVLIFFDRHPVNTQLFFKDDGTFTIRVDWKVVSSSQHNAKSLWTLITPTQPHHATALLFVVQLVSSWVNLVDKVKHFWNGWLSRFLNAVNPSRLPFTPLYFSLHAHPPIKFLLSSHSVELPPTFDEWDEVNLETVTIVMRMKTENKFAFDTNSEKFGDLILGFALSSLKQTRHCATRLTRAQLEHLIAPSIDCINTFFQHPRTQCTDWNWRFDKVFKSICSICDEPTVTHAITNIATFSRLVDDFTSGSTIFWSVQAVMIL